MKPIRDDIIVRERGDKLRTKKLSIDEASLEFIIHVLTTLYKDPAEAVIREYATNAWDSHLSAGNDRPIEITKPNRWEDLFIVQDYGVGLSSDDLYDLYSKYGASTKRDSDVETGMLGLGSKSGLAYADQFTLECVKDGRLTKAIVARSDSGGAGMTVVAESDTDLPNGVKFSIRVKNATDFNAKIDKVFKFWKHGKVLIDGKEPELIGGEDIGHDCYLVDTYDRYNIQDYIVMGNVYYPTNFGLRNTISSSKSVVHYAPMGAVEPVPSREELKDTKHTREYVEAISIKLISDIVARVQETVNEQTNVIDAYNEAAVLKNRNAVTWNGYRFDDVSDPANYAFTASRNTYDNSVFVSQNRYASRSFPFNERKSYVVVTGYSNEQFQKNHALKINMAADVEYSYYIVLAEDATVPDVLKGMPVVDWADAKDLKLPTQYTAPKFTTAGRYYVYDALKGAYFLQDTYKDTKYVYFAPNKDRHKNAKALLELFPDHIPVKMNANRLAKFGREHPKARHSKDAVEELRDEVVSHLTHSEKLALAGETCLIDAVSRSKILDPDVQAYMDEFVKDYDPKRVANAKSLESLGVFLNLSSYQPKYNICTFYPLLEDRWGDRIKKNGIEYINAVYLYRQGQTK